MILLLFAFVFISCVILMFSFSFRVNAITSSLYSNHIPLVESSIPLTMQEDEVVLYFDQEKLKENYKNFLEKEIEKYVDSYTVNYYFYNLENGGFCDVNNCQGVEIYFSAKIMLIYEYQQTLKYEIHRGDK